MKKKHWLVVGGAAASAAGWYVYATSRLGAKKVPYTVIEKDGRFELRDYPPMHVAVTHDDADDAAFRRLFRFISRGNARKQKIAMTTPVFIDRGAGRSRMAFVMPAGHAVPDPADESVKISSRAGGRVAVVRFGGSGGRDAEQRATDELRRAIAARGLEAHGDPIIAYYDSPWTPALVRRNEVMLRLR